MSLQVNITKKLKAFTLQIQFDTDQTPGIGGILGASGCGKSMTLKCIAGIETPDDGRIVLNGRVLFDSEKKINVRVQDRHVGYLFQSYALFPNMTVEENIRMAMSRGAGGKRRLLLAETQRGTQNSTRNRERTAEDYMGLMHIQDLKDSYPKHLSGGQQQRVALARMLASEPELLMFDEPFSALDSYLKEKLQLELLELLEGDPRDILMVTHSRDEVYRFCSRIHVLEKGIVVADGETKAVFRSPQTVAAAKLTGCKNITPAQVRDRHTLWLPDWQTELSFTKEVPEDTAYIGVRAHFLHQPSAAEVGNLVSCRHGRILEDPFEIVAVFDHEIWWKTSKEEFAREYHGTLPETLLVPEEAVLFLRS